MLYKYDYILADLVLSNARVLHTNNMTSTITEALETTQICEFSRYFLSFEIFKYLLIHVLIYTSDDVFHLLHQKSKSTRELVHKKLHT